MTPTSTVATTTTTTAAGNPGTATTCGDGTGRERVCRFYQRGNDWFFNTGLPSDIILEVEGVLFHLHKFPLMSKCGKIAHILEKSQNTGEKFYASLMECPGGSDAFLVVAKFCYGVRVELTPKNILMVYRAADYLEMTEDYGEENLLAMAEAFFNKVILRNWKDCILALQNSEFAISKGETLQIVNKSLNALSMMVCTDPSLFGWPMMMYGSLQSPGGSILWNGISTGARIRSSVSDWWFEDISCLSVPLFKQLIETMKERGIRPENIAGAVMHYARKYLPGLDRWHAGQGSRRSVASFNTIPAVVDQKVLLESIEMLLPEKKGKSFCRFLLGLLRFSMILNVRQSCKDSLERRIGMQLELANLEGLLIPSFSDSDNLYDTDCVERIIQHFLSSEESNIASFSPSSFDPAMTPSSSPFKKVTKLIDSYLAEVAPDVNLKPETMRTLAEAFPRSLRSLNDGLYRALDIYFKAHPWLSMNEREQLCNVIDYGLLSIDACTHASQNERLPLRVVLQVLYFEQMQLRAALSRCLDVLDSDSHATGTAEDMAGQVVQRGGWVSLVRENHTMIIDMQRMRSRVRELELEFVNIKQEMHRVGRPQGLISSPHMVPRRFGCMPLPRLNDPQSDTIESTSPSPRKSAEQPHRPRHSRHRKNSSLS